MSVDKSLKWEKIEREGLDLDYCPQFLGSKRAFELLSELEKEVEYFTGDLARVKVFGKWHNIPRKQVAFGDPGIKYKYSGVVVPTLEWPDCLLKLRDEICEKTGRYYNFVLVNRYKDGKDHMGEHKDDEPELDQKEGIASVSLGATRDFIFRHGDTRMRKREVPPLKIPLVSGSLLLMNEPTNKYWYHSLPQRKKVLGVRINLTFRKIIPSYKT